MQKVRQGETESLKSYVDRFNMEGLQVNNLNHETTCEAIKKGFQNPNS